MTAKKSGWAFFLMVLLSIAASVGINFTNFMDRYGIMGSLVLSELILVIPGLIIALCSKEKLTDAIPLQRIRFGTIPLVLVFMMMIGPLVTLCNLITLQLVSNEAAAIMDATMELSYGGMFLYIGVLAPFLEECIFRGILYSGFRNSGTPLKAIIWTAVLFGLFHMNLNQMAYAIVLGIAFGLLREATGNIWCGIIGHMAINGSSVFLFWLQQFIPEEEMTEAEVVVTDTAMQDSMMLQVIVLYLVIALVTTAIAGCILVAIAKRENGLEYLKNVFTKKSKTKVWSIPLWLGIMICVGMIILFMLADFYTKL